MKKTAKPMNMAVAVGAITTKYFADNLCFRKTGAWCTGFSRNPACFKNIRECRCAAMLRKSENRSCADRDFVLVDIYRQLSYNCGAYTGVSADEMPEQK